MQALTPELQTLLAQLSQHLQSASERALQLKAKGWGKAKIILEIWGVTKILGTSPVILWRLSLDTFWNTMLREK
jgi:hypothetical protein